MCSTFQQAKRRLRIFSRSMPKGYPIAWRANDLSSQFWSRQWDYVRTPYSARNFLVSGISDPTIIPIRGRTG